MKTTYIGLQEAYNQKKFELESNIKNIYLRRRYAELKAKGLCTTCGNKLKENKYTTCKECRAERRKKDKERRLR